MEDVVCLFHEDCLDGLGAAWAVLKRYPDGQYIPVNYKNPPPEGLAGKHVVIVDFSYSVEVMREIIEQAAHVTFLDHHERSYDICAALTADCYRNLDCDYDANRSGATMAWDHFHPGVKRPRFLEHVADQDLWRFELEGTKEIMLGIGVYPMNLTAWHNVLDAVDHNNPRQEFDFLFRLQSAGEIIKIKMNTDIDRIIKQTLRYVDFLDFPSIPLINVPRSLAPDALMRLANDHEFALGYFDDATHRIFSLRSRKGGRIVNQLARHFGGDGHPHAAGFAVPREHPMAKL